MKSQTERRHAGLAVAAAIFAAAWLAVRYKTVQAEWENPPLGEFITVQLQTHGAVDGAPAATAAC